MAENDVKYKRLLIQQQGNESSVVDTLEEFNVVCQKFPFKQLPEVKDLPKRGWPDENGEDLYIPTNGLKFKAYDLDVKFLYVGTEQTMQADITSFINYLYGRNTGGSPKLKIYDEYTKKGRQGVYVQEVDNELLDYNDVNSDVIALFKVKFRITNPVTDITLTKND